MSDNSNRPDQIPPASPKAEKPSPPPAKPLAPTTSEYVRGGYQGTKPKSGK